MLKKILAASVFAMLLAGSANAAPPADAKECQALVQTTFSLFDGKQLSDAKTKEAEDMLDKLVEQCQQNKFSDAEQTAATLKEMATQS